MFRLSRCLVLLLVANLITALGAGGLALAQSTPPTSPFDPVPVTLRESTVFTLYREDGSVPVVERARAASRALLAASSEKQQEPARWESRGGRAVVLVGSRQIVSLSNEDALAANVVSVELLARQITSRVQTAVTRERQRMSLANTVFSVSLVVFFGLITLYVIGRLRAFCDGAHTYLVRNAKQVPALHLNKLEVLGPASVRNALIVLIGVGRVLGVLGLGYAWLVVSLSLFERTRPMVPRLTGVLLTPLSALVARLALALPMFVIGIVAIAMVAIAVRVTQLFFASIERGETRIAWVPPDLAYPISVLVRGAVVLVAPLFAGPLLTGDHDGPLSRSTLLLLGCIALSATPLLASLFSGMAVVFARTFRIGDRVQYGGHSGRVSEVRLLWLVLEDETHAMVRVPHLRALWYPTRIEPRELP